MFAMTLTISVFHERAGEARSLTIDVASPSPVWLQTDRRRPESCREANSVQTLLRRAVCAGRGLNAMFNRPWDLHVSGAGVGRGIASTQPL